VGVGTKVTIQDVARGDVVQYSIVGSAEANPSDHKLSNESPVGHAIMGHKPGEIISVRAPRGETKLKIIDIERA
jgi:transcription elongation factor GreA